MDASRIHYRGWTCSTSRRLVTGDAFSIERLGSGDAGMSFGAECENPLNDFGLFGINFFLALDHQAITYL